MGSLAALFHAGAQTHTFTYTGSLDSLQIPNCVDSILINAWGAQGSNASAGGTGGKGAYATGRLDVTPGDWIYVTVGGQDGYNGGGLGGPNGYVDFSGTIEGGYAGNGGGASDIRQGGKTLTDRILVAAGGGGGGNVGVWPGCQPAVPAGDGGEGSGVNGGTGSSFSCGCSGAGGTGGITATTGAGGNGGVYNLGVCGSGGSSENGQAGTLGTGGNATTNIWNGTGGGGGGGGGFYGGGAGASGWDTTPGGGGGGGSSYTGGVSNGTVTAGIRNGNGQVSITFILSAPIMTTSVGQSVTTLNALQSGVSYQWLNCGAAYAVVPGATNQSFTASANGSYAVELDNGNGCVDTSACFTISQVGLTENAASLVSVYPNPANDFVQVTLNVAANTVLVQIFDLEGRLVLQSQENSSKFDLNLTGLESGVYVLQLKADDAILSSIQLVKN